MSFFLMVSFLLVLSPVSLLHVFLTDIFSSFLCLSTCLAAQPGDLLHGAQ